MICLQIGYFTSLNLPHAAAASDYITPRTLSQVGFISPPASAAAQAGVKFAVAHNTPAFFRTQKRKNPISPHPAKLATGG
jgi:hypothetical protein